MKKIDKTTFPKAQLLFLGYNVDAAVSYDVRKEEDGSVILGLYDENGVLLKPTPLLTPAKPEDITDVMANNYHTVAGAYRDLYTAYNKLKSQAFGFTTPVIQAFIVRELEQQKNEEK